MTLRLNFVLLIGLSLSVCFGYGHGDIVNNVTDLNLIGLFPLTGLWDGGLGMLPAAEIAVDDINNRSDILPGYRLKMMSSDTGCDRGLGIKAFLDIVRDATTKIMIIGAGCSRVSQVVAQAAHHWNLVQISYISTSPTLSGRRKYPNFFRILSSERVLNEARIQLFKLLNWTKVAVIYEHHHLFTQMVENLVTRSKRANIEVINKGGFSEDPAGTLQSIMEEDARIIVGGFHADKARMVFCAAYNTGFYGKKVWITSSFISEDPDWWNETDPRINCTADQLLEALQGSLVVSNIYTNMNETEEGLTGLSLQSFRKIFKKRTRNMTQPVSAAEQAPIAYDTVWAAAVALNKTMNNLTESGSEETLANFSYNNKDMADLLKDKLREVEFTSVSGRVAFTKRGDGIRLIGIYVFQGSSFSPVGIYDRTKDLGERLEINIDAIWKGDIPKDSIQTLEVVDLVPIPIYAVMTSLTSLGIILALLFLCFNVFYRDVRIIKMSSPDINNITLLGCVLAYLSVCIEDIHDTQDSVYCKDYSRAYRLYRFQWQLHMRTDSHSVNDDVPQLSPCKDLCGNIHAISVTSRMAFISLYQVKISLLLLAFSLSFGALFAKTWRTHRIFTASRQLKKQIITDFSLCLMILGLVCLNTLVITVWFVFDPQTILTELKPHKEESDDLIIHHLYTYCSSDNESYFLIAILTIQGIFLFLGVFLAWEIRKVPFSILNESRYIGMCVYNVVTLGIVGAFVSLTIRSNTTLVYVVVSSVTILCTTVTQCLLFVPKIIAYRDYVHGKLGNESISSIPALAASLQTQPSGINAATQTDDDRVEVMK